MPAVVADESRCARDGLCISVCPLGILEADPNGFPSTRPGYENHCITCGHCVAVCSKDALQLGQLASEALKPTHPQRMPTAESVEELMRSRRSIRRFRAELIERSVLEAILEVARYAPSGKNRQPLRWTVVSGAERIREAAGLCIDFYRGMLERQPEQAKFLGAGGLVKSWEAGKDEVLRSCPHLLVAHGPARDPMLSGSAFIALSHVELVAHARSLGACWAGYLHIAGGHPPLREALRLPEGDAIAGAMMLGKPAVRYRHVPERKALEIAWI